MGIIKEIIIIFALATGVNFLFTRIKIPTVVGYLLTGILAGPHLLGLVGSDHSIEILAEVGVALLLFTIGMEFSLKHLMRIRRIVFFGGFLQVFLTAAVFYVVSLFYDLDWQSAIFVGFLIALSSSALVLKLLQERSEISSNYGRTVLGILIFQDLILVPLLLFTNIMADSSIDVGREIISLSIKTTAILAFVYVGNKWLFPWLLHKIAMTKNQELFIMSILLICFSIAMLTHELGMSIAFGAFLAGLMISDSEYSHNAFAKLMPFKDIFTSFFFVSVGMLLDLTFIVDNPWLVLISVVLVIVLKTIIAGSVGFILGHTFKGTVLVGLALSQVGEFSFILAKIGVDQAVISNFYFQLFLAVSVTTMAITPFLIKFSSPLANRLLKLPLPDFLVNGLFPLKEIAIPELKNHLVIIGKDASAIKLSLMAKYFEIKHASIIFDPSIAKEKMDAGDYVVYGDAVNDPILLQAHVDKAEIVVISIGNMITSMAIIDQVRQLNKNVKILARVHSTEHVGPMYEMGADQVLPEKLEIAIDLFNRVLVEKLYPLRDINRMLTHLRNTHLGEYTDKDKVNVSSIFDEMATINIAAVGVEEGSEADGKSVIDLRLRKETGATLLAIKRGDEIIEHPDPAMKMQKGDITYLLGDQEKINFASELFSPD
ncbi:MAG: cation:proton antiporter [Bacteroidales bacterium]